MSVEKIQNFVDSLTEEQINEIYKFYDHGCYDHLMRYPSFVVPRSDISLRKDHLVRYLSKFLENPDPDVPQEVLGGTCSFEDFKYTLQLQAIGEPLMHRLNQDTETPILKYSEVSFDLVKSEIQNMRECLHTVYQYLGNIPNLSNYSTTEEFGRTNRLVSKSMDLIHEHL